MMQVIIRLSRDKGVADDISFVNTSTRVQEVTKGLMYHPVGTPHDPIPPMANVMSETYPPLASMPFG